MRRSLFLAFCCASGMLWSQGVPPPNAGDLKSPRVFAPDDGKVRTMANGGKSRDVLRGALLTGEPVNVHESVQQPGTTPNAMHTIAHSEFILVREGTLLYEHDGMAERAETGSLIYVPQGTLHTVRNAGGSAAKYVVIAMGGDAAK